MNKKIELTERDFKRLCELLDKPMEEFKKGNVSEPIDMEELNKLLEEE